MYPCSITQISYSNMAASVPDDLCIVAIHLSDNLSAFVMKLQSAYFFVLSMYFMGFWGIFYVIGHFTEALVREKGRDWNGNSQPTYS